MKPLNGNLQFFLKINQTLIQAKVFLRVKLLVRPWYGASSPPNTPPHQLTDREAGKTGPLTTRTWSHFPPDPASLTSQVIHSSRVLAGTPGRGFVANGALCVCQGTGAVNPPERHQSEGPGTLIGVARVHKWQIMTYKWEFMWPLGARGDPGRDGEGAH